MGLIMDGKLVSNSIRIHLKEEIALFAKRKPKLTTVLVGNDEGAKVYIRNKEKACAEVGILSEQVYLPEDTDENNLYKVIQTLNQDATVDGILIQMPLPKNLNNEKIIQTISPEKDVDCLHPYNLGLLCAGNAMFTPNTPQSVISMLEFYNIPIQGKKVVVIGRSNIVGKPVALLLLEKHATVTICHSKTENLPAITKQADILVVAIGKAEMVTGDFIKPGAVVCDVGINAVNGKITGDVAFDSVFPIASFVTPVPGGIGSLTTTLLLKNTVKAFRMHQ
jgi:methylenetetrahydrofolate dehydrogenase (NADP+)/methenyltetrahydrofolate cyclohydrolase